MCQPQTTAGECSPIAFTRAWEQKQHRVWLRFSADEKQRLDALLRARGVHLKDWVLAQLDRCASDRLPESQGDVKRVIPPEVSEIAEEVLSIHGNAITNAAKRGTVLERADAAKKAAPYLDAAAWFGEVNEDRRFRRHVIDSGQRTPRHRLKASPSPAVASSSATKEAPTG